MKRSCDRGDCTSVSTKLGERGRGREKKPLELENSSRPSRYRSVSGRRLKKNFLGCGKGGMRLQKEKAIREPGRGNTAII